ncbi:hypothetical protein [Gordonia shandongensis]|uniref:hypothetical protein n=1 Tax=Gordonia shandongensis TaxID=376351 RepID=UPI0012EC6D59|nr:hypothetical protein [Gordonia shandongensis]
MIPPVPNQQALPQSARSRTGAIVALVIGAALTVSGPVIGILIGSFALVPHALGYGENAAHLAPTATIEIDADDSVLLLAPVADLVHAAHGGCTGATADGAVADISYEPAGTLNTLVNGTRYESFARVTAGEPGTYTLACHTPVDVIAAPTFELGTVVGTLGWRTAGGLIVSVPGVVLAIIGTVRLARTPKSV